MIHPHFRVSDRARSQLLKLLQEFRPPDHAVTLVWATEGDIKDWRWEVGFHAVEKCPEAYLFTIDEIPFYFDGPFYTDERSVEGRRIDYIDGIFVVGDQTN